MEIFEQRPNNVAFGSTTERKNFPFDSGKSRFGNHMNPITGAPNVGPGKYENEEMTCMVHLLNVKPMSKKGYSLGARFGPRLHKDLIIDTPGPGAYEPYGHETFGLKLPQVTSPDIPQICKKPVQKWTTPGPGTYEQKNICTCRHVEYSQSFGGSPTNLPCVSIRSTVPRNTDKLPTTLEEKRFLRRLAYLKLYY